MGLCFRKVEVYVVENFNNNEWQMLSNCIINAIGITYEAIGKLNTIGLDTSNLEIQIMKYRELNDKVCQMDVKSRKYQ